MGVEFEHTDAFGHACNVTGGETSVVLAYNSEEQR